MRSYEGYGCLNILVITPNISAFLENFTGCFETFQVVSSRGFVFFLGLFVRYTLIPLNPVTPE